MRIILVVLLSLLLQGCWFIMFPLPRLGASGNLCVGESASVGQTITNGDKKGVVQNLYGRSERCQQGSHPILADVKFE